VRGSIEELYGEELLLQLAKLTCCLAEAMDTFSPQTFPL